MIVRTISRVLAPGLNKRAALTVAGLTVGIVLGFNALFGHGVGNASAENAALVINAQYCTLLDGNGDMVSASSSHVVTTQSANGNVVLKCSVKGVPNSTGRAVHFDYDSIRVWCQVGILTWILTSNWHIKVSKSGNATLTCSFP